MNIRNIEDSIKAIMVGKTLVEKNYQKPTIKASVTWSVN